MEILKQLEAKEKAKLVIKSCKNKKHIIAAKRFVNLFTRTPSSGSISKSVIMGPGDILTTRPETPYVSNA